VDYIMHAEGGKIGIVGHDLGPASVEERIQACEVEIAKVLEKYGCNLVVAVAVKP
jgi:ATP phosphoribosyltransferase